VRVYLKDNKTGLFFVSEGCWTESRGTAKDFKHSPAAIVTAHKHKLKNAVVVFVFEGSTMDMCIAIGEEELSSTVRSPETKDAPSRGQGPRVGAPSQRGLGRRKTAAEDILEGL
jgi:hypothetical protein